MVINHTHINIVQENSLTWEDPFLGALKIEELFGWSAEKIGEVIVSKINAYPPHRSATDGLPGATGMDAIASPL